MNKVLRLMVFAVLVLGFAGCGDRTYVQAASPEVPKMAEPAVAGSVMVAKAASNTGGTWYIPYGQMHITLNEFTVAMDDVEDGVLEFVVPEVYSRAYSELVPTGTLQNLRLMQGGIQVGPTTATLMSRQAAPENSWKDTTYAYIPANIVIPRGATATFRIVGDAGWSWVDRIVVTLPNAGTGMFSGGIGGHIIVRGVTSGRILKVKGESIGDSIFFFDPYWGYGVKG